MGGGGGGGRVFHNVLGLKAYTKQSVAINNVNVSHNVHVYVRLKPFPLF